MLLIVRLPSVSGSLLSCSPNRATQADWRLEWGFSKCAFSALHEPLWVRTCCDALPPPHDELELYEKMTETE